MATKYKIDCLAKAVIPELLTAFGSTGTAIRDLYLQGKHAELVSQQVDPKGFSCWQEFMRAYSAVSLLRKYPGLKTGINLSAVALEKFLMSETQCRSTNLRISRIGCSGDNTSFRMRSILERTRSEVHRILRSFSWDATLPFLAHGPGATFGTKRERGHPWYKFGEKKPTVTGECLALARAFIDARPLLSREWMANGVDPTVCIGSKIATVPKDARSNRVIAIEPMLNMYFQKGIGGLMRSRLKQTGCNLNDQTRNQELALEGSKYGHLATIDLASASDTVSSALVEFLFPEDWLMALKICRSTQSLTPGGEVIFLQKFSSMGNGYTFELESCIFLALTRAVCAHEGVSANDVSIYGDDIVAPVEVADLLKETLEFCGFTMNLEKSFIEGPFRESCGKHYFLGRDVTPFYLKKKVVHVDELFWLANSIRRLAFRLLGLEYGCHGDLLQAWTDVCALVLPRDRRYLIPEGYGDTGLLTDFDEVAPSTIRSHGVRPAPGQVEGYTTKHLVRKYKSFQAHGWPALVWRLSSIDGRSGVSMVKDKGALDVKTPAAFKLRAAKLRVQQWRGTGPWVDMNE